MLHPNAALIGVPGGRWRLDTPALLIEAPLLAQNIAAMAEFAANAGVKLRPHAKSHKSVILARQQIAAGAIGISCATLGEAEIMREAGLPGILITSPVIGAGKLSRLADLAGLGDVMVVADHPANIADLARCATGLADRLGVLVDIDAGQRRTGCADIAGILALARLIAASPNLRLRGLQAYAGHLQHIAPYAARQAAAASAAADLAAIIAAWRSEGLPLDIISGGGTGTAEFDAYLGYTELQPGSYVFMDAQYHAALADRPPPFATALFVQTSVVSLPAAPWVTTDAGLKALATDGPAPEIAPGAGPRGQYSWFGDEYGKLTPDPGQRRPDLGDRVELVTPHCDPTVHLYDVYHLVAGDRLLALWPVDARGRR